KIREASIYCRRAGRRRRHLAWLGLAPVGLLISRSGQLHRHRRNVWHSESDVIEGGAARGPGRLLLAKEDEGVRKLYDVDAAHLDGFSAQRVGPKLLVRRDAGDVEMVMAYANRRVGMTDELRETG